MTEASATNNNKKFKFYIYKQSNCFHNFLIQNCIYKINAFHYIVKYFLYVKNNDKWVEKYNKYITFESKKINNGGYDVIYNIFLNKNTVYNSPF